MPATDIDAMERIIRMRRTHKMYTGAPVERALVERVLDAARWAPNHGLSEPWRFYALDQPAIVRLTGFLRATPQIAAVPDPAKATAKLAKLLDRLPSAGALVLVTWVRAPDAAIDMEEHAAVSAAIENALLTATALGLASYWSTSAALVHPETLRWAGADPSREGAAGAIWIGHAMDSPAAPPRTPLSERLRWVTSS